MSGSYCAGQVINPRKVFGEVFEFFLEILLSDLCLFYQLASTGIPTGTTFPES